MGRTPNIEANLNENQSLYQSKLNMDGMFSNTEFNLDLNSKSLKLINTPVQTEKNYNSIRELPYYQLSRVNKILKYIKKANNLLIHDQSITFTSPKLPMMYTTPSNFNSKKRIKRNIFKIFSQSSPKEIIYKKPIKSSVKLNYVYVFGNIGKTSEKCINGLSPVMKSLNFNVKYSLETKKLM